MEPLEELKEEEEISAPANEAPSSEEDTSNQLMDIESEENG
jgi:hypothetical protein